MEAVTELCDEPGYFTFDVTDDDGHYLYTVEGVAEPCEPIDLAGYVGVPALDLHAALVGARLCEQQAEQQRHHDRLDRPARPRFEV